MLPRRLAACKIAMPEIEMSRRNSRMPKVFDELLDVRNPELLAVHLDGLQPSLR
jgi:hypothetical protein